MTFAFRCAICGGEPTWRLDRWGDAVVSWACAAHLPQECENLQRDWEITQLSVRPCSKLAGPVAAAGDPGEPHRCSSVREAVPGRTGDLRPDSAVVPGAPVPDSQEAGT